MFVEICAKQPCKFGFGLNGIIRRCRGHEWVSRFIDGDLQIMPGLESSLRRRCPGIGHVTQIADINHEISLQFNELALDGMTEWLCSDSHKFRHIVMPYMGDEQPGQMLDHGAYTSIHHCPSA